LVELVLKQVVRAPPQLSEVKWSNMPRGMLIFIDSFQNEFPK